jgi:hypothetical protein
MTQPKSKYHIEFAKDKDGSEIRHRFMLVTSKPIKSKEMAAQLHQIIQFDQDGIDNFEVHGRYTMEIVIARTFDPDEVIAELKEKLDILLSNIIQPGPKGLVV